MERAERTRRQRLGSALERLDAAERRTLADLRYAGYAFTTVEAARRYWSQLRAADRVLGEVSGAVLGAAVQRTSKREWVE